MERPSEWILLFEALDLQLAKHMPVNQVARFINESNHKIWSIIDKYVELSLKMIVNGHAPT